MSDIALEKIDDKLIFHDDKKDKTSLQEGPIETINDKIIDNTDKLKTLEDEIKPLPKKEEKKKNINIEQKEAKEKIDEKQDTKTSSILYSINNIKCKKHGVSFLNISRGTFNLVCSKCLEEGIQNFDFEFGEHPLNKPTVEKRIDVFECYTHYKDKGSYYCDECKQFICKFCFAEQHRNHKCHLPEHISKEFKEYIDITIDNVKELKPILEGSLEEVKQIYTRLKAQKDDTLKIPETTIQNIKIKNEAQMTVFNQKFESKMNGVDKEIEDDTARHNKIKEKTIKYLQDFEEYNKIIKNEDKKLSNVKICQYHKNHLDKFKEISEFISNSLNFLNNKLQNTITIGKNSKTQLLNDIQLLNKSITMYENCTSSSILTGQANNSILLRRFLRFVHNDVKYFKITSLIVKVNSPIFLTGLSVCGLYIPNRKATEPNYSNEPDISLNIIVSILEENNNQGWDKLISEKTVLLPIRDKYDPANIIYFVKGVKLNQNKKYLITIENNSNVTYCDLWVGGVKEKKVKEADIEKKKEDDDYVIRCHNTNIDFSFSQTQDIQTDFDEFTTGIIEGILFSKQ